MKKMIAFLVLLICLIAGALFIFLRPQSYGTEIYVYFFNPSTGVFETEIRNIPNVDIEARISLALGHLRSTPSTSSLTSTWPVNDNGDFLHFDIRFALHRATDTLVLAIFLYDLPPLNKTLFNSSIVFTLEGIVSRIIISYEDNLAKIIYLLDHYEDEDIQGRSAIEHMLIHADNNPSITPGRVAIRAFTLYFANDSGDALVSETYISTEVDLFQIGSFAMQLLINGPSIDGAVALIPPETRVISVEALDINIYVNLSGEFHSRFTGDISMARLMILSIVNTLERIPDITASRVNFLIDSEPMEHFHGINDFHMGFLRNDDSLLLYE